MEPTARQHLIFVLQLAMQVLPCSRLAEIQKAEQVLGKLVIDEEQRQKVASEVLANAPKADPAPAGNAIAGPGSQG